MKAIVFHKHGDPSVLRYTDVPEPALRHNEALVRVRACALNHLDLWFAAASPALPSLSLTYPAAMLPAKSPRSAQKSPPFMSAKKSFSLRALPAANVPPALLVKITTAAISPTSVT